MTKTETGARNRFEQAIIDVAPWVGAVLVAASGATLYRMHEAQSARPEPHPAGAMITELMPNGTLQSVYRKWSDLNPFQRQEAQDNMHGGVSSNEQP